MDCAVCPYLMQALETLLGALWRSIPLMILGALLGLLAAGLALWQMRRCGFFQRSSRIWKFFTYSYYLTLPLACVLLASSVSATLKLKSEARILLETGLKPAVHNLMQRNVASLRAPYPQLSVGEVEKRVRAWISLDYWQESEGGWDSLKARVGNRLVTGYNNVVVPLALKGLLLQCGTGALQTERDASVLTDCMIANAESFLFKQAWKQLASVFNTFLFSLLLIFLLVLTMQFLEAGIYFFWYAKRHGKQPLSPTAPRV